MKPRTLCDSCNESIGPLDTRITITFSWRNYPDVICAKCWGTISASAMAWLVEQAGRAESLEST